MNNKEKKDFSDALITQRKDLKNTITKMKDNDHADQSEYYPTELSSYDNHPAELGTELFQVELNSALMVHQENLLKETNDAIGRIDNGIYGKCAFCGNDIGNERLKIVPHARLCIECEESKVNDPEIIKNSRPNEELVLDAPLGRKYLNKREDDEYEGMDQFNDLMKYGSSDSPQDLGGYNEYEEFFTNKIDNQGIVDNMDKITNEEYKKQLP